MITIALSKGRLAEKALDLLEAAGYDVTAGREESRKLILQDEKTGLRFIMAKPADVPTYVEYGAADIGVVGKDTLLEEGRNLYEVIDLGYGACRMCVCGPASLKDKLDQIPNKRVGTKYPNITRAYFEGTKKESVEMSGRTLKENGLDVLEVVADISARVVVNRVSMKMKESEIVPMLDALRKQVAIKNAEKKEG